MFRVGVSTFWQDFILIQFSTYFLKALSFLLPLNTCNLQIKIFVSLVIFRNTWTWITTGAVCSFTVSEGDDSLLWKCVPMWPWLAGGNQNIPNHTNQSSHLSSVWRLPNKQWLHAGVFFPALPLPYFDASTSPLESVFDLIQLLVSLNVQIDSTVKYVCFAGLDLRSGNTLTINKFEKWCFELMSGLRCDNVTFNGTILKTNGCHSFLKPT